MRKSQIMKRAWSLAAEGKSLFGGKKSEYISESLKIAWKEIKMPISQKKINITQKHAQASLESVLRTAANRTDMSESRTERAVKKLAEFLATKPAETDVFFLFGNTFSQKDSLKAAGWKYDGNVKAWWSREDLDSFGFQKISA